MEEYHRRLCLGLVDGRELELGVTIWGPRQEQISEQLVGSNISFVRWRNRHSYTWQCA